MPNLIPYAMLSRCIGVLLLAAAVLKFNGLAVDPVGGSGYFTSTAFQVAVIEFEVLFGIWLLWGVFPAASWVISIVVFSIFAIVSGWQGWIGRASCGCFGQVTVSPWWTFLLDLVILTTLAIGRPSFGHTKSWSIPVIPMPAVFGFLAVLAMTVLVLGGMTWRHHSIEGAFAALRGERISIYPRTADVGTGQAGQDIAASVQVVNRTNRPIHLLGGTADCSCVLTGSLPITIPPKESRHINVDVRLPKQAGLFTRKAGLVVDDDGLTNVWFRIAARVNPGIDP
jgi:hypothetical protein